jgi:putative ABC transport system permease protein
METLLQDVRFGLRMLSKNRGFTAVAVATLALAIAANTTIFSAVNGWMLRRPRIKNPASVVVIVTTDPAKGGWGWDRRPVSAPDFLAWREQSHAFEDMAASEGQPFALTGDGEPERLAGERVSANYFDVLGVSAALGRTFLPGEDQAGRGQVVILSHRLWQRRFGSNPKVVGQVVRLNGESHTVVGVMPGSYRLGVYGGPQLWAPLVFSPESVLPSARENRNLEVLARLKSGATVETAKAEMTTLAQRSEQNYPGTTRGWGASAMTLQHYIADEFSVGMRLQMGVVIFVLLIACANTASLLLSRATERRREFAVRTALGASRFRLVRQLLIESLLIALAGGGVGLLLASWGVTLLRSSLAGVEAVASAAPEVTIDRTVVAYTLGISVLAAILLGLAPALRQTRQHLQSALKEGGRASSQGKARQRMRSVLVTAEIALAVALLIGAGAFLQDFLYEVHGGFGIDPHQVLTASISLSSTRYKDPAKQAAFFQEAIQRLEALPGVISAGATSTLVPGEDERIVAFSIEGQRVIPNAERPRTAYFTIAPEYLRALRIPLLGGRALRPSDTAHSPPVAVVNQAFAQRYFPNEDAIGNRVRIDGGAGDRPDWNEIVGVVGNVRAPSGARKNIPQLYESYLQRPSSAMTLVLRASVDPAGFAPLLRRAVWAVDKDQPLTRVQTMNQAISDYTAGGVVASSLMGIFAGLGLALATVGVFGVTAYVAAQRTQEIGIRIALGAQRSDVLRMVLKKGMVLGAFGIAMGLALGASLVWLKLGLVNDELLPFDQRGPVFLVAVFLIWAAGLLANYIPARRATKVDPMVVLRWE